MKISISRMRFDDISRVQEIERKVFPTPWSRATFEREVNSLDFHYLIVAKVDERIVGYACFFSVLDEGHITNIGVDPAYQREGIGTQLMLSIVSYARRKGISRLMLEVRPSNHVALHLYHKFGFFRTGLRKGYYTDTGEDALVLWTEDIRSSEYRRVMEKIADDLDRGAA